MDESVFPKLWADRSIEQEKVFIIAIDGEGYEFTIARTPDRPAVLSIPDAGGPMDGQPRHQAQYDWIEPRLRSTHMEPRLMGVTGIRQAYGTLWELEAPAEEAVEAWFRAEGYLARASFTLASDRKTALKRCLTIAPDESCDYFADLAFKDPSSRKKRRDVVSLTLSHVCDASGVAVSCSAREDAESGDRRPSPWFLTVMGPLIQEGGFAWYDVEVEGREYRVDREHLPCLLEAIKGPAARGLLRAHVRFDLVPRRTLAGGPPPTALQEQAQPPKPSRVKEIEQWLAEGHDPNERDNTDATPLMRAAEADDLETVKLLLERGARAKAKDCLGTGPLMHAAENGNEEMCRLLLGKGADVNVKGLLGGTPLIRAAKSGNERIVRMVLERGASVHPKDDMKRTALWYAVKAGSVGAVHALREYGAGPMKKDEEGKTVLDYARESGREEVVQALLAPVARKSAPPQAKQPAAQDLSAELLSVVPQLNVRKAAELLAAGADVNARKNNGKTPLILACEKAAGNLELVTLLLDKGANVKITDTHGWTALMEASRQANLPVMQLLLDRGADVDVRTTRRESALMLALQEGQPQAAHWLLDHGADASARAEDKRNVLLVAAREGHADVVKRLLAEGRCGEIDAPQLGGMTPLMYAAHGGHLEVLKMLLDHGADVNARSAAGYTALMQAIFQGRTEIVRALLDRGADVNAADGKGQTALMHAVDRSRVVPEIVDLLFDHGANAALKDKSGHTAASFARPRGRIHLIQNRPGRSSEPEDPPAD